MHPRCTAVAILAVAVSLLCPAFAGADTDMTRRARSDVREGPGSYYPLVCVLPAETRVNILAREGSWFRIGLQNPSLLPEETALPPESGLWISRNCFVDKPASTGPRDLAFPWESLSASPSAVAAAVRGFALRFDPARAAGADRMERLVEGLYTPEAFLRFREDSERQAGGRTEDWTPCPGTPSLKTDYDPTVAEEGVGRAIAARIAERGITRDRDLLVYVNLLAAYLAEHTGAYDTLFRVYVLEGDDLYAMAVPGGTLFLTEGMVRACRDEAELAAVIAHEMMHVVLRHGLREMGERPVRIKADLAIQELERKAGQPADPAMEALERLASDAFESVHKPRLQQYEVEADRGALYLLARAGYDPHALPRMVNTIGDRVAEPGGTAGDNPFLRMDFRDRAREATACLEGAQAGGQGVVNRERFLRHTSAVMSQDSPSPTEATRNPCVDAR